MAVRRDLEGLEGRLVAMGEGVAGLDASLAESQRALDELRGAAEGLESDLRRLNDEQRAGVASLQRLIDGNTDLARRLAGSLQALQDSLRQLGGAVSELAESTRDEELVIVLAQGSAYQIWRGNNSVAGGRNAGAHWLPPGIYVARVGAASQQIRLQLGEPQVRTFVQAVTVVQ